MKDVDTDTSDSERKEREKQFHDQRFTDESEDVRDGLQKYYSVYEKNARKFNDILEQRMTGSDVLEYGCATGEKSLSWAGRGARVHGIDISTEAIRLAGERARSVGVPAEFHAMDAEHMTFPDESFDLVFGEGILHHLDLQKSFGEISRVLRANGSAVFTEPLGHNPIINLYRRLTPEMRTDDEHPLLKDDLKLIEKYFNKVDISFFHISTLVSVPFRRTSLFRPLLAVGHAVDSAMMALIPPVRHWAWVAVLDMSQPRKI